MFNVNEGLKVGDRFRLHFDDSKMEWVVEIVEPNMRLFTEDWFGREAETMVERDPDGDLHPIAFKIVQRDVTHVDEEWAGSPEVNETPVWTEEHALCYRVRAGWMVEFDEFSSLVTPSKL